ncbi:MAG TPA: hypothetical protein VGC34_13110 [Steroidobacteraceae bacterium]
MRVGYAADEDDLASLYGERGADGVGWVDGVDFSAGEDQVGGASVKRVARSSIPAVASGLASWRLASEADIG